MNVRVLRSITEVSPEAWDALCGDDPVFCHGWFRALEQSGVVEAQPRHVLLDEDGRIIGILPCFIQHGDPYYTLEERLFGPAARLAHWVGGRALPALIAYTPLGHKTRLFLAPGVDRAAATRACLGAMDEIVRRQRLRASAWLFVPGEDREVTDGLRSGGYRGCVLAPEAVWRNRFAAFEAYVQSFKAVSADRYGDVRHELNRQARSGVVLAEEPLDAISDEELEAMRSRHYARHYPGRPSPFSRQFFAALKRGLGPRAMVHTARKDGRLISYSIALKGGTGWHMFMEGIADEVLARADKLHFNLNFYFPIRRAIEQAAPQLEYGLDAYDMKVRRGCELEPRFLWIRAARGGMLRLWLPWWLRLLDGHTRRKHAQLPVTWRISDGRGASALVVRAPWWRRWLRILIERHTFVLCAEEVSALAGAAAPRAGWSMRVLEGGELRLLDATMSRSGRRMLRRFEQDGAVCYGAWRDGQLGAYFWVSVARPHWSEFFGSIPCASDEAHSGYVYVWPQHRGQGLARWLKGIAAAELRDRGVRVIYSGTTTSNVASLKSHARGGAEALRLWHYRRVGPWVRRWSEPVPGEHPVARLFAAERARAGLGPASVLGAADPLAGAGAPSWPKRLAAYLRRRGLRALAWKAWRKLVKRVWDRCTMLEWVIPIQTLGPIDPLHLPLRVEVRQLDRRDFGALGALTTPAMLRFFTRLLDDGATCYAGFIRGELVAHSWYTDRPYRSPDTRLTYPLEAGERFWIYSYVLPQWRSRGVEVAINALLLRRWQRAGLRAVRTLTDDDNRPPIRGLLRWGALPCRQYRYRRFLGWRRVEIEPLEPSPALLVRLAGRIPRRHDEPRPARRKPVEADHAAA